MAPLNRQDKPPKPGPRHEVWRIEPPHGFTGQIVSVSLWGVWTHWDGYRTRECTAKVLADGTVPDLTEAESEPKTKTCKRLRCKARVAGGTRRNGPCDGKGIYTCGTQSRSATDSSK